MSLGMTHLPWEQMSCSNLGLQAAKPRALPRRRALSPSATVVLLALCPIVPDVDASLHLPCRCKSGLRFKPSAFCGKLSATSGPKRWAAVACLLG